MRAEILLAMLEKPEYRDMRCGTFAKIAREAQKADAEAKARKSMEPVDADGTEPYFERHLNKEGDAPLGSNPFMEL